MKFTIKRSGWLRGMTDESGSYLRSEETGKKCCLGFMGQACGASTTAMTGLESPCDFANMHKKSKASKNKFWKKLFTEDGSSAACSCCQDSIEYYSTDIAKQLISVNDSADINDKERESKLKKLFRKIGVSVTFVD